MDSLVATALFALGAVLGSFAGVIAERAYTGQSWMGGRSRCNACARTLSSRDLIPVFSWLFARGSCRSCGARIPYAYALLEALLALAFFGAYRMLGLSLPLLPFLIALFLLAIIVVYD